MTIQEYDTLYLRKMEPKERWLRFESSLNALLSDIGEPDLDDLYLVNDIKQAIIVFAMQDTFSEGNEDFLYNMRSDFSNALDKLETKYPDINTFEIRLFMDDFYFNKRADLQ